MGQGTQTDYQARYSLQRKNAELGLSVVRDDSTGQEYLMQEMSFPTAREKEQEKFKFQARKKLQNDNFLGLIDVL
jgi:hypothetical protein